MTPAAVISSLVDRGIRVSVASEPAGEYLELAPAEAVTREVVALVRRHKPQIVAWLTSPTRPEPAPAPEPWPPERLPPTPEQWQAHREHCFQEAMAAMRQRYGVDRAVDTGPATAADIEAAREALGNPANHEDWQAAVTVHRREPSPGEIFEAALQDALGRLAAYRFDNREPGDDDGARDGDLELDLAAAGLDTDNPLALDRALTALHKWEQAWIDVAASRAVQDTRKEARA
ncbi:hypothetical protein ACFL51_00650 [Myxococcota bacterium]